MIDKEPADKIVEELLDEEVDAEDVEDEELDDEDELNVEDWLPLEVELDAPPALRLLPVADEDWPLPAVEVMTLLPPVVTIVGPVVVVIVKEDEPFPEIGTTLVAPG